MNNDLWLYQEKDLDTARLVKASQGPRIYLRLLGYQVRRDKKRVTFNSFKTSATKKLTTLSSLVMYVDALQS